MKKFFALLLSLALITGSVFVLASCGGNSDDGDKKAEDSKKEATIVGEWKLDSYVYTFNEDGTGQYDAAGTIMKFTYKTEGEKLSILYDGNTDPFETTYSIDGDKLNVRDSLGKDTIYTRVK